MSHHLTATPEHGLSTIADVHCDKNKINSEKNSVTPRMEVEEILENSALFMSWCTFEPEQVRK